MAGAVGAAWSWCLIVLVLFELRRRRAPEPPGPGAGLRSIALPPAAGMWPAPAGLAPVAWVALKVGALSFGGGFVIVPLMQGDAVHTYHWMTSAQFLDAVALGQVTPGPVVATVAAVGYAAHGVAGAVLAAAVAFLALVCVRAARRRPVRADAGRARAPGRSWPGPDPPPSGPSWARRSLWPPPCGRPGSSRLLAAAAVALLIARRGIVVTLLGAGIAGAVIALAGGSVPQ